MPESPRPSWSLIERRLNSLMKLHLHHPCRLAIVHHLWPLEHDSPKLMFEACVKAGMTLDKGRPVGFETFAYHVRELRNRGTIELVGRRMVRGAVEHRYRLTDSARTLLLEWVDA